MKSQRHTRSTKDWTRSSKISLQYAKLTRRKRLTLWCRHLGVWSKTTLQLTWKMKMCAVLLSKTTEKSSNLLSLGRLKSSTRSRKRRCLSHLTLPLNWLAIVSKLWGTLGTSRLAFPIKMRFCLNSGNSSFRILSRFKHLHSSRVLCKTR